MFLGQTAEPSEEQRRECFAFMSFFARESEESRRTKIVVYCSDNVRLFQSSFFLVSTTFFSQRCFFSINLSCSGAYLTFSAFLTF